MPKGVVTSGPWRALMVEGPLDHAAVGVLASISATLAAAQISIFAISTYDTDWVLVPEDRLETARAALLGAGHQLQP
ncbi:MAG TPA: ACT domain-containing protein [Candidatus Dormibacteraeota bacterium]|nr:ACT domain-containing protein [Candidatus Dormibacteraeota bacterium]